MKKVIEDVHIMKVGTNVLYRKNKDGSQSLNRDSFRIIGRTASSEDGHPVLVSSGAIAAGMMYTSTRARPNRKTEISELQRLASIGWLPLLNTWNRSIKHKNIGGVLLTRQELGNHPEREEALSVIHTLLSHKEVPIVNENDSVSHEEITFGDNDILAATLAACMARSTMFGNVKLFLLSDVNGVYENKKDPRSRIPTIENIADYRHLAQDSDSDNGTGGMISKFLAADIVNAAGVDMWLYDGLSGSHRHRAIRGQIGTYFPAKAA